MKRWVKRVHFVGIGGIGMSGIAEVLLNLGFEVSGSDQAESAATQRLRQLGARVGIGHRAENVAAADVVVVSSAIKPDNPEVLEARDRGIPVIPRAEMLAELMRMKRGIAVSGAHGKTTTTSMIAAVLSRAGLDPTAVIGGRLNIFNGANAKLGEGEWLVAEADESDGSFLHLTPTVVVVTNIDREHMDHYQTMENLHEAFIAFMNSVPFYGQVVAGIDDAGLRALLPGVKRPIVTYGRAPEADFRAENIISDGRTCCFTALAYGRRLGEVTLGMPGEHNALNALAALAVATTLEVNFETAAAALHHFGGVGRRFEFKGEAAGVMVIDDYGHHPTEIKATLKAAKELTARRGTAARLIAAFQPHRYTRTKDLWEEFCSAFFAADLLFLTEIYSASEPPIPGITGAVLAEVLTQRRSERGLLTRFVPSVEEAAKVLAEAVQPGDVVLTLGAGNIYQAGGHLLALLAERER